MTEEMRLDEETWMQLVKRGREEIRRSYPDWTNDNASDPGITLLELFAFLKEIQNFHMDQTGPDHLKKYLKLLGLRLLPRRPGHTMVTVRADEQVKIPAGFQMYAGTICFETTREQMVADCILAGFRTECGGKVYEMGGQWLEEGKGLTLYPFGFSPAKGDSLTIRLSMPLIEEEWYCLYLGSGIWDPSRQPPVKEESYDGYGYLLPARISLQAGRAGGFAQVEVGEDTTYGLCQSGEIWFRLPFPMDREAPALRLFLEASDYTIPPMLSRVSLSMTPVVQTETRRILPVFEGTGLPNQRFDLGEEGTDRESITIRAEEPGTAGGLRDWTVTYDLDHSGPEDCHCMLDGAYLVFGDGFYGMMPEGEIQVSRWVTTQGKLGNIKSGTITAMEYPLRGVTSVSNERDVEGGCQEETIDQAFSRYRDQGEEGRAVTLEDYERLVRKAPGLWIDDCRARLSDTEFNHISIAVKPHSADGMGKLRRTETRNLYCYLEEKRLVGTRITLLSPDYVPISVACEVVGKVKYRNARRLVEEGIRQWMAGMRIGQRICYGQLFGYLEAMACVFEVKSLWLNTWGRGKRSETGDVILGFHGLFILKEVNCTLYTDS